MPEALLIQGASIIARNWERPDSHKIAALCRESFSEGEAHRLVALLPIAFSRPILEKLGLRHFVDQITVQQADGITLTTKLSRQPEFVGGLKLARRHCANGRMDPEIFKLIAGSSADVDAVSNAINEGVDIQGSTIAWSLIGTEIAIHLIR